ncbi:uncharacterized protein N7496_005965 [Penicillium cataractarum]|uniref:Uncharacterized protein n=1 Tax=Penicillium cataractarum TaxID=2100454 RepID=A0A9W9S0Q0_9EURO|nr:uncharacterized protein N7496_005965 [Penicillium cataractarum]KAJ5369873.1 hypothetical protein N7496_005965 [Penicillium cataractarum]
MAQRQLSQTLPKNFTFPSLSTDEPKTPERESAQIEVPPPPRHSFSSCRLPRVRVRSGTDVCERINLDLFRFQGSLSSQDVPVPSIEYPQGSSPSGATYSDDLANDDRFLAPPRQRLIFKTPPAQVRGMPFDGSDSEQMWPSWDETPGLARNIKRPGTACSDSSCESVETYASRPSVGGSCTSVESDSFDHAFVLEIAKEPGTESPTLPERQQVQRPLVKDKLWTREMDNHLWNTYQMYLQDPTITPFKQTPGSIPPLGVTARVARRAKRTWDSSRRLSFAPTLPTQSNDRSGSSTPRARESSVHHPAWPRSDAKTRCRLKHLCRRKFSISPYYHRIMQSRSPEPMADTLGVPAESHVRDFAGNTNAYATRDLGVSLVSTEHSNVLAQLAKEPVPGDSGSSWFNNAIVPEASPALPAPQPPTQLYQFPAIDPHNVPPRLGSPFVYSTWGPGGSRRHATDVPQSARRETIHVPNRRLRRATHLETTPRDTDDVFTSDVHAEKDAEDEDVQTRLEHFLRENKFQSIGKGRVRLRNRGATTSGAVAPRDVDQLFSPPSSLNSSQAEGEETTPTTKPPINHFLSLGGENIKRLGSPFKVESAFKRRDGPGRFIRHAPSLSEPFPNGTITPYAETSTNPTPFQEQKTAVPVLRNPFEEGLSDAERIRRQIQNMSSLRQ